jgi:hypothetical protein
MHTGDYEGGGYTNYYGKDQPPHWDHEGDGYNGYNGDNGDNGYNGYNGDSGYNYNDDDAYNRDDSHHDDPDAVSGNPCIPRPPLTLDSLKLSPRSANDENYDAAEHMSPSPLPTETPPPARTAPVGEAAAPRGPVAKGAGKHDPEPAGVPKPGDNMEGVQRNRQPQSDER